MKRCLIKILSVAVAAVLALCCAASAGAAGSYFLSEGYSYGIDDNEAYVHGYEGEDGDVVIRETFLSYYVTAVEDFAFFRNTAVQTLYLYDATRLSRLGTGAFADCVNLQYVELPSTIRELGASVFDGCASLSYVRFREGSAASVPAQAFYCCRSLRTVVFENVVTDIGAFAFANCTSLSSITLPDTVVSIADNAFSGCDDLTIRCGMDSYAMQYAIRSGIDYAVIGKVTYLLGDADGDGEITILDATRIQRLLVGFSYPDGGLGAVRGDCSGDGLDILDATKIQRSLVGFHVNEPIGQLTTVTLT